MTKLLWSLVVVWVAIGIVGAILFLVRPTVHPSERVADAGTLALAWATFLLALMTVQVAWHTKEYAGHTKKLVDETKKANENAEAAMRAQFRPLVVLRNEGNFMYAYNIGAGPALNVEVARAQIVLGQPCEFVKPSWSGMLLLGRQEGDTDVSPFSWGLTDSKRKVSAVAKVYESGEIQLVYHDVFGRRFETSLSGGKWSHREIGARPDEDSAGERGGSPLRGGA